MNEPTKPPEVNDMYEMDTPEKFLVWYDAVKGDLIGNYSAKSEALEIAVRFLRPKKRVRRKKDS